ncbi:MAG: thiamine pyrophosphate-binding protein [Rhodobacteraceae bacterium]|nr:thiamine pyrophosphate-binding protein [Paracoccaceae bacterium]
MMQSGGQILANCLAKQGVKTIFGVPGESYLAVLDALVDHPEIRLIGNRNEGGAAFMACAHGQLTGQPGICMVTRGPGATNASIGVHSAMQGSNPMILFIGQVGRDMRGREAFQEVDYRAFFGPIAKWVTEVDDADRISETLARAFTVAQSGRPGPVVIALPEDMLRSHSNAKPSPKVKLAEAAPTPEAIYDLKKAFARAEKPLLLIGGGGWNAEGRADLQTFVEQNNLPVASAFRFQDLLDNHSPSYIGDAGLGKTPALKATIEDADLIFALNIRFGENTTDGYQSLTVPRIGKGLIHSHISDLELGKIYQADVPIHAGPNALCKVLAQLDLGGSWQGWATAQRAAYEESMALPARDTAVDMGAIITHLQSTLPENAILTNGAGNFAIWHNKFFHYGADARLLAPQSGAMGYGLPAAIAAKAEHPDRLVLCFAGDGDFQMNMQELGTAMQAGAQPIVIVVNNGVYGTIRMHQERDYPNRQSFTKIENPDFVAIAKAYGFHAETVTQTADFPEAFTRAAASTTGALIELLVDPEYITPKATLSQIRG